MKLLDKKNLARSFELETDSLSQMDNLQLLRLNYVQFNEFFQNFPQELRWLCMHGLHLKSIHFNLPMENLVALDMSYSTIESFDMSYSSPQPPAKRQKQLDGSCSNDKLFLGSLKILDMSFCEQLRSIGGFSELPALERLIVKNCISLTEVSESVRQCIELVHIDLSNCYKLKVPVSLSKLKKVKTLLLDGCDFRDSQIKSCDMSLSDISINSQTSSSAIPSDLKSFTVILPSSLITLSLANNNLTNESFPMDFSCLSMLEELRLDNNPIVSMPNCVKSLGKLEKLSMDNCEMVVSIDQPPRTLTELSVDSDNSFRRGYETSLKIIKFHPEMARLRFRGARTVITRSPYEIDGMIKIQAMADVEEKILHSLGWTNLEFIKERHLGRPRAIGRESIEPTQTQVSSG
ncbi:disease resistance protein ADR2-like [Bidens hawaiensis]|uniref:disease resistance protein ADR2-like n=1 Tax=Bidens hawaiensis TaxID=980011 RepID=UPI004049D220